ncbi:hypothetical protein WG66_008383 [Moniliophthora roreri]|nr:hypothetical protein WG66_008383 [Moniliophthora roreri]
MLPQLGGKTHLNPRRTKCHHIRNSDSKTIDRNSDGRHSERESGRTGFTDSLSSDLTPSPPYVAALPTMHTPVKQETQLTACRYFLL